MIHVPHFPYSRRKKINENEMKAKWLKDYDRNLSTMKSDLSEVKVL